MTMAEWTGRELMAMADTHRDAVGECDSCHNSRVDLYELDDDTLFCRNCLCRIASIKIATEDNPITTNT